MKPMKSLYLLFFTLFSVGLYSQDFHLIRFVDKPSADFYLENPTEMLTQKALERREKHGIALNLQDVPVETEYIEALKNSEIGIYKISKWFNGVFAYLTEEQTAQAEAMDFVEEVVSLVRSEYTGKYLVHPKFPTEKPIQNTWLGPTQMDYGLTQDFVEQINLQPLHEEGFLGDGIQIALFDNGYVGVDFQPQFSYIRDENRIKDTYDFAKNKVDVFETGSHGSMVLSTIAAYEPNLYIGTAVNADFYLYVIENNDHEGPDEEINWLRAAEYADSLGVDIINTSLGYSTFDDPRYNYSYEDMNGQTTYISQAAQMASDKGIMVVVSNGNEGNKNWYYLTPPADADRILAVGAVDIQGEAGSFSSYGPTSDGRIKPDISAMGVSVPVYSSDEPIEVSGTSLSAPIITGAVACLMQAYPDKNPETLRQHILESAHLYDQPDDQMGYGIPDFGVAMEILGLARDLNPIKTMIYPNPAQNWLYISSENPIKKIQIISFEGKRIQNYDPAERLDISHLSSGTYFVRIQTENGAFSVQKLIKY